MKQHITIEQLNELDNKVKGKLREWWSPQEGDICYLTTKSIILPIRCVNKNTKGFPEYYSDGIDHGEYCELWNKSDCYPLLNIGQMIEFIGDSWREVLEKYEKEVQDYEPLINEELCDALWEAVKYILK